MAIEAGQQLLHYRLIEKIGEGGMGVVWKALDTTLDREVAIKLLPAMLAGDAGRLARFEREAKLLASLNHPNIATLHGLHEDREVRFLAMELVEGDDLSQRLSRGPLAQDQAVEIARQITEGLEAAHAAGVIHRDLKPANIKIGPEGRVKLLDFGLARAFENAPASGSGEVSPTMSPTLTSTGTLAGVILGTAAYMSPEQARGHTADSRADVWSFGVVLYEMLSGRSAFKGDTVSDTLASVLKIDPDFDALPPPVPHRIRRLVTRCLQKDRKQRLHHIADARILLEESIAGVPDEQAPDLVAARKSRTTERFVWLATLALVGIVAATTAWNLRPAPAERPHRKILLALDGEDPEDPGLSSHRVSPDGERIVYRNGKKIFIRDLDAWSSREIPAAEGATQLFWSYDGASFGFVRDDKLWRVSADGSDGTVICELPKPINGATWSSDGTIIMAMEHWDPVGLYSVSERGGDPEVMVLSDERAHFHDPHVLPDGRGVLVSVHSLSDDEMRLGLVAGGKVETFADFVTRFKLRQVYSSGHVLYYRGEGNRGIWAAPFSPKTLQVTGDPFLVAPDGGRPSVSRDGTLLYREDRDFRTRRLVWVDRQGEILGEIGHPQEALNFPSLSPDGGRIAVSAAESTTETNIWIVDVARGAQNRLTFEKGTEQDPVWTLDGRHVIYRHRIDDERNEIRITRADGSSEPEMLVDGIHFSLSPDGKQLIFTRKDEGTGHDLWYLELGSEGEAQAIVMTPSDELDGRVSPDGEYLAYRSDETGDSEIFIKRFPSGEGKWQASVDGGTVPRWSPKGDELFWVDGGDLLVVEVETRPELKLGTPRILFSWKPRWALHNYEYDIAADAERFVLVAPEEEETETLNQVRLVENWSGE